MSFAPTKKRPADAEPARLVVPRGDGVSPGLPLYVRAHANRSTNLDRGSGNDVSGPSIVGATRARVAPIEAPIPRRDRLLAAFADSDIGHDCDAHEPLDPLATRELEPALASQASAEPHVPRDDRRTGAANVVVPAATPVPYPDVPAVASPDDTIAATPGATPQAREPRVETAAAHDNAAATTHHPEHGNAQPPAAPPPAPVHTKVDPLRHSSDLDKAQTNRGHDASDSEVSSSGIGEANGPGVEETRRYDAHVARGAAPADASSAAGPEPAGNADPSAVDATRRIDPSAPSPEAGLADRAPGPQQAPLAEADAPAGRTSLAANIGRKDPVLDFELACARVGVHQELDPEQRRDLSKAGRAVSRSIMDGTRNTQVALDAIAEAGPARIVSALGQGKQQLNRKDADRDSFQHKTEPQAAMLPGVVNDHGTDAHGPSAPGSQIVHKLDGAPHGAGHAPPKLTLHQHDPRHRPDPIDTRHAALPPAEPNRTHGPDPGRAPKAPNGSAVGSHKAAKPSPTVFHKRPGAGLPKTQARAGLPPALPEGHDHDTASPIHSSDAGRAPSSNAQAESGAKIPQRPGEAITAAQQKIVDLNKQAAWKKDQVKAKQIEKARRVGAAGLRKSNAAVVQAEAELKQAQADAKQAQTETRTEGAQHKQEAHATIESLTQELERSIAQDIERVQQSLAKDLSEIRTRLDEQQQTLRRETDKQCKNLDRQLANKEQQLEDQAKTQRNTWKKQVEAQQLELERQATEEKKQLRETSRAEAKRVDDAAKSSAKVVEDQGNVDARTVEQQAADDAARARSDARAKAGQLRAEAEKQNDGVLGTIKGWFSKDPGASAIQAGEQKAQDLVLRGKMSGETLRSKAKASADDIRKDGQKQSLGITKAADQRSQKIDEGVANAKGMAKNAADARNKALDDEHTKAVAALEAEIATSKQAIERQLSEGLADLGKQLATAQQKLQADAENSIAQIKTTAKATRQKLASGLAKDVHKLEQMVHKTCADLDRAADKAANDLHVTVKQAELQAAKTVTARLAAINELAEQALAQIDEWVERESRAIMEAAEHLEQQIANIGKQTAAANEKLSSKEVLHSLTAMADTALLGLKEKEDSAKKGLTNELQQQQSKIEDLKQGKKDDELEKAKAAMAALEKSEHWYRTDSKSIVGNLKNMTPVEREALRQAYKAKTGEDLDTHLSKDLAPAEMKLLKAEWSHDPVAIAEAKLECAKGPDLGSLGAIAGAVVGGPVGAYLGHELGHAVQSLATDTDSIKNTLSDPKLSDAQRVEMARMYEKETGQKLDNFLKEQLAGKDLQVAQELAPKLPPPADVKPAPTPEQMQAQEQAAKQLRQAMDGFHTNTDKLLEAMKGKNPAEIAALKALYKDHYHVNLDDELERKLKGTELKEAKAYLSADAVDIAVAQLQEAQDHWHKTDSKKIQDTLEGIKDPDTRAKVAAAYEKQTGLKLDTMLSTQLTGMDRDLAQALAEGDDAKAAGVKMDKAMNGGVVTGAADWMADKFGLPRDAVRKGVGAAILTSPLGVVAQLATGGTGALGTTSFGADDAQVNKLLEACKSPAERQTMIEAYKARTGKDLKTDLTDKMNVGIGSLDGTGKLRGDIATALLEGDTATASAAKMELSTKGIGKDIVAAFVKIETYGMVDVRKDLNDQKAIFAELEGKSPEERKAIVKAYCDKYGKDDPKAFEGFLEQNLGGMDLEKARLLEKDGKVPPEFAAAYAMDAWRTDNAALKKTVEGKTKAEVDEIRAAYNKKYAPKKFDDEIDKNTHGETNFYVKLALEGEPQTAQEKIDRMKKIHDYERGAGGENKILQAITGVSGFHNVSNFVTDLTSDSGKDLDRQYAQIIGLENEMKKHGGELKPSQQAELDKFLRYGKQDQESYQAAKDTVTTALATAATVVVGAAVSVLTAGAAAPAVIAAVAALAGGVAGIGVKMVMKGDAYGNDELLVDAGMTIVNAVTAGTLKLKVLEDLAKASPLVFSAVSGAVAGALSSGAQSMMTDTEAHNLLQALAHAGSAAAHGAVSGAVSGVVAHGLNEGMDASLGKATSAFASGMRGFVSGTVSGVAGALTDPAVLEGDWVDVANRLGTAGLSAGIMAAGDSAGAYRHAQHEAVGTAAKAARQAELSGKTPAEQRAVYEHTLAAEIAKLHGLPEPTSKEAPGTGRGVGDEQHPAQPGPHGDEHHPAQPGPHGEDAQQPSAASERAKALKASMTPDEQLAATKRVMALRELFNGPDGLDLPGTQKMRVVPDHIENLPPGCVRESDARNYMKVAALAENVPAVRELLETLARSGGEVTFGEGNGSYRSGDRINLAAGMTPEEMMGALAHEAHHLATFDRDVSINAADRTSYEKAALKNEAEAQVKLFEAHRQLLELTGKVTGQNEFGAKAYRAAMIEGEAAALAENPLATNEQVSAKQREYAVAALEKEFAANGKPSTSYNEKGELIPGKPATYKDLYGEFFDKHSPNGADALKAKAEGKPFNAKPEALRAPAPTSEPTRQDEPVDRPKFLNDKQKEAVQAEITKAKPLTPAQFLDPAMDQGHVQQLKALIDKGYYFRDGELVAPRSGTHVEYDPAKGFVEAPGRKPPEQIKAGTSKEAAFEQLGGSREPAPAPSTDPNAPKPAERSPLDRWVDAATEAVNTTPREKLDVKMVGLADKLAPSALEKSDAYLKARSGNPPLDHEAALAVARREAVVKMVGLADKLAPSALEKSDAYLKARSGNPPLDHEAALAVARREAVIEHLLEGVKVDKTTKGLPKDINEDAVRGHIKDRIPLDDLVADLPFDKAKKVIDSLAPSDKGNTYEAWETKAIKDELRNKLIDQFKQANSGKEPDLVAINAKVEEQVQAHVTIPNERSTAPEDLERQAKKNLAKTNPEKASDPAAIAEEAAKIEAKRKEDVRKEAIGRLKAKHGEAMTEDQILKEIEKLSKERKADLVIEPVDSLAKEKGVKIKELKSTNEGMNEHDELQSHDYLKAIGRGELVGDPPRPITEVSVKFADARGAQGSAKTLADLLVVGEGKFTFEIADPKTGTSRVVKLSDFVGSEGESMTRKAIEAAIKAGNWPSEQPHTGVHAAPRGTLSNQGAS